MQLERCVSAAGAAVALLLVHHDTSLRAADAADMVQLDNWVCAAGAAGPPLLARHGASLRAADAATLTHLVTCVVPLAPPTHC